MKSIRTTQTYEEDDYITLSYDDLLATHTLYSEVMIGYLKEIGIPFKGHYYLQTCLCYGYGGSKAWPITVVIKDRDGHMDGTFCMHYNWFRHGQSVVEHGESFYLVGHTTDKTMCVAPVQRAFCLRRQMFEFAYGEQLLRGHLLRKLKLAHALRILRDFLYMPGNIGYLAAKRRFERLQ